MKKQNIIDELEKSNLTLSKAMVMADEIKKGFLTGKLPNFTDPKEKEVFADKMLSKFERYSVIVELLIEFIDSAGSNIFDLQNSLETEEVE